jgi:hypothetical protein
MYRELWIGEHEFLELGEDCCSLFWWEEAVEDVFSPLLNLHGPVVERGEGCGCRAVDAVRKGMDLICHDCRRLSAWKRLCNSLAFKTLLQGVICMLF